MRRRQARWTVIVALFGGALPGCAAGQLLDDAGSEPDGGGPTTRVVETAPLPSAVEGAAGSNSLEAMVREDAGSSDPSELLQPPTGVASEATSDAGSASPHEDPIEPV